MIRLICSDVDGTIVPDGTRQINPELFEVIERLHEKGIHFAIASGRAVSSIRSLFEPVEDKLFLIALGGAMIATSRRTLFHWDVDQRDISEMVRQIRRIPGCEIELDGVQNGYLETKDETFGDWVIHSYGTRVCLVDDLLRVPDPIVSVSIYHSGHQVDTVLKDFMETWRDRYAVVTSGTMWVDVQRRDTNKGRAVAYLQDSLGIRPQETMVFGDQRNDIEMMGQACYSYAVENALEEVKAAARFRTGRCDEDGVLRVLRTLLAEEQRNP